mgnify:CR=1 FL=1
MRACLLARLTGLSAGAHCTARIGCFFHQCMLLPTVRMHPCAHFPVFLASPARRALPGFGPYRMAPPASTTAPVRRVHIVARVWFMYMFAMYVCGHAHARLLPYIRPRARARAFAPARMRVASCERVHGACMLLCACMCMCGHACVHVCTYVFACVVLCCICACACVMCCVCVRV